MPKDPGKGKTNNPAGRRRLMVEKALTIRSLVEAIEPNPAPDDAKSGWPNEMVVHEWSEYGWSDAESRYQPSGSDTDIAALMDDLLAACKRECEPNVYAALALTYRVGRGGIRFEQDLMPLHEVADRLRCPKERAVAYLDEAKNWIGKNW